MDVAPQFFVVHFGRLFYFLLEVNRRLIDSRESGNVKSPVVLNGRTAKITLPALLTNPALQIVCPMRPLGLDPMDQLESRRIKLEHWQVAELIAFRIEKSVIVAARVLPENPLALRIEISLRRFTLDQA